MVKKLGNADYGLADSNNLLLLYREKDMAISM